MSNLLSGISDETRVIMIFGLMGFILLIAGAVLIVGLRRQSVENAGRFDIPSRKQKQAKPEKAPKPGKVKAAKPAKEQKSPKPVKQASGGMFKKAPKASGITLLAAPVGSQPATTAPPVSSPKAQPTAQPSSDDFDIPSFDAPASKPSPMPVDDDFDVPTFAPPAPPPVSPPPATGGPFGRPSPAGDDEW